MSSSFLRPRSPPPSHTLETESYIRSLHTENARLKAACRALEDGLTTTARELRRSAASPTVSPHISPRRVAARSTSPLRSSALLDSSVLSEASTINNGGGSPYSYRDRVDVDSLPAMRKLCLETECRLYDLQSQLAGIETEAIRRRNETIVFDNKVEDLREAFDLKSAELSRTKEMLSASNQHVLELERLLAARPASPGPLERQALDAEIQRLRVLLDTSRDAEARLRDENRDLNVEVMSLKRTLHDLRTAPNPSPTVLAELSRLQAEIKIKDEQLCSAKVQMQEANYACGRLGRELDALRTELRSASSARTVATARDSELKTLQSLYRDKRAECAALQTELVETKGRMFLLESELRRSSY